MGTEVEAAGVAIGSGPTATTRRCRRGRRLVRSSGRGSAGTPKCEDGATLWQHDGAMAGWGALQHPRSHTQASTARLNNGLRRSHVEVRKRMTRASVAMLWLQREPTENERLDCLEKGG